MALLKNLPSCSPTNTEQFDSSRISEPELQQQPLHLSFEHADPQ